MEELLQRAGIPFGAALGLAIVNWVAVAQGRKRLVLVAKPATMLAIIFAAWRLTQGARDAWLARFFLPGLALCLVRDVALMLPHDSFLAGLVAFLLAHCCYTVGLTPTPPQWRPAPLPRLWHLPA